VLRYKSESLHCYIASLKVTVNWVRLTWYLLQTEFSEPSIHTPPVCWRLQSQSDVIWACISDPRTRLNLNGNTLTYLLTASTGCGILQSTMSRDPGIDNNDNNNTNIKTYCLYLIFQYNATQCFNESLSKMMRFKWCCDVVEAGLAMPEGRACNSSRLPVLVRQRGLWLWYWAELCRRMIAVSLDLVWSTARGPEHVGHVHHLNSYSHFVASLIWYTFRFISFTAYFLLFVFSVW